MCVVVGFVFMMAGKELGECEWVSGKEVVRRWVGGGKERYQFTRSLEVTLLKEHLSEPVVCSQLIGSSHTGELT